MANNNANMSTKSEQDQPNINIDISDAGVGISGQQGGINNGPGGNIKNMNVLDSTTQERSGLSKDELMKYANQPFWVRLRNILFSTFWILWLSILVAAIGYVYQNPNCNIKNAMITSNSNASSPLSSEMSTPNPVLPAST